MIDRSNIKRNASAPSDALELLPPGTYVAKIIRSDLKVTRKGNGEYIEFTWLIVEGDHAGQKVWQRLNVKNTSAKAVSRGHRVLSMICLATGKQAATETAELHHIACRLCVRVSKGSAGYRDSNEVSAVMPLVPDVGRPWAARPS